MADESFCIIKRLELLKRNAAERCHIKEEDVHIGHMALQAMLDEPDRICQIDVATDKQETNKSVARRTCRLASAMVNSGLRPGDCVVIMGNHHLDVCIPYFACHFGGYSMCTIDPTIGQNDLIKLFPSLNPKIIFCKKFGEDKVRQALKLHKLRAEIVIFDDDEADIKAFVKKYNGTQVNYRPAEFDHSETIAWLMLTSGTTGSPKVAIITFDILLNAILSWWKPFPAKIESSLALVTLQWVSSLIFFISGPLKGFTRLKSSEPKITPKSLVSLINKYRPATTVWAPYVLTQFLGIAENHCDLSCFKYLLLGGSPIEKPVLDRLKKVCGAFMYLVYGMTELLAPIFDFDEDTPFGSSGKPNSQYEYKLMGDNGQPLYGTSQTGELWVKGNGFFKGYLDDPEETSKMLTKDGWFMTGDMFYRDKQNYYYFVERKRLIIKHYGAKISPLQMEEIIKRHPGVAEVCVVGLPDPECMQRPIAAVLRRNGNKVDPQEIVDLLKNNMVGKTLSGGIFFVDALPVTPSGKIHRAQIKEMATKAERIFF